MRRDVPCPSGSADEARTPPASVPHFRSELEPLLAEARALIHSGSRARGVDLVLPTVAKLVSALEESLDAALHDALTGLSNRFLILDHLQIALARAARGATL